jgi:hypothetical protein
MQPEGRRARCGLEHDFMKMKRKPSGEIRDRQRSSVEDATRLVIA